MNEMIIALCKGKVPTKEQIEDELYDICDRVHAHCSESCPVYDINEGVPLEPDYKGYLECRCFKSPKMMFNFIREKGVVK